MRGPLLGVALLLPVAGCSGRTELPSEADTSPMIFVRSVLTEDPYQCTASADPISVMLLGGSLDLSLRETYVATLLVGNTQPGYDGAVSLDSAEVELTDSSGGVIAHWNQATTGHLDGRSEGYASWGAALVELVDEPSGAELLDQFPVDPKTGQPSRSARVRVGARVRLHGVSFKGAQLLTPAFTFPIELCYRCLVEYPLSADDPSKSGYQCSNWDEPYLKPCRLGQDSLVDCRLCLDEHTFCECPTCQ